jgi:hypothetical protein
MNTIVYVLNPRWRVERICHQDIVDYKRDEAMAVPIEDKHLTKRSGQRRLRKTTQGGSFLVNWKDGTESWLKLAELKDSYPIELAEFARARHRR